MTGSALSLCRRRVTAWWGVVLLVALLWAYWPRLEQLAGRWAQDPQYTHAYVVPVFAAVVLWFRRDRFPAGQVRASWWGVVLLVAALGLRLFGTMYSFDWLDAGSLLPALAGVVLLVAGP